MSPTSGSTYYGKPLRRDYAPASRGYAPAGKSYGSSGRGYASSGKSQISSGKGYASSGRSKPLPQTPQQRYSNASSSYSRFAETSSYDKKRRSSKRGKVILYTSLAVVFAILVTAVVYIGNYISTLDKNFSGSGEFELPPGTLVEPEKPGDPFWMLLMGTDNYEAGEQSRSDTIILARIDPGHKKVAVVSIPRDTYVAIPGYGSTKINAAYAWGGPELAIKTVSEFLGIDIAYYAEIDISGFKGLVDVLGGVWVDVPVDVYNDYDHLAPGFDPYAKTPAIIKGEQLLEGDYALLFVRSRYYELGDYQRQANQRTFLQALARRILSAGAAKILETLTELSSMTTTTFGVKEITSLAYSLRGMKETDIYTYSIPCDSVYTDLWYEMPNWPKIKTLMDALVKGDYPDPGTLGLTHQGTSPDSYNPNNANLSDILANRPLDIKPADYVVDVRNGNGIAGCAGITSDFFVAAGYQRGELGNTKEWVYPQTLIIYQNDSDRGAALDVRVRLGYGRVIPSRERYNFNGNILIVLGDDYGARNS